MDSDRRIRCSSRYLAALAWLCAATVAVSAPRFIAGSKITPGDASADIEIEFACNVEYAGHAPFDRGDTLRIRLEPTGICNGASPQIARSREQYRPLQAERARLSEIEYDGETGGGQALTLVFAEPVRFEVVHNGISNHLTVRVGFGSARPPPPPLAAAGGSTRVQKVQDPAWSYVINLSSAFDR